MVGLEAWVKLTVPQVTTPHLRLSLRWVVVLDYEVEIRFHLVVREVINKVVPLLLLRVVRVEVILVHHH